MKQKQLWKKFVFVGEKSSATKKRSFSIESAFEVFFYSRKSHLNVLVNFLPSFHVSEKKFFYAIVVCEQENVYNHLKNITVEYKRHYANRTYFCHFPS